MWENIFIINYFLTYFNLPRLYVHELIRYNDI